MTRSSPVPKVVAVIAGLAIALTFALVERGPAPPGSPPLDTGRNPAAGASGAISGDQAVLEAFTHHANRRTVMVRAAVVRLFADDREGARHQRFLIRVGDSVTVLVAHNIDLAPRVPVAPGDTVVASGEYVWTAKGGTLHWTHHDPEHRHAPGYIELGGHRYE